MKVLKIHGPSHLDGSVNIQGSKNAVLPIMAAAVMTGGKTVVKNCPDISDIRNSVDILRSIGCRAGYSDRTLTIDSSGEISSYISEELMGRLRSSFLFTGAILARCSFVRAAFPGGCKIGARPVDIHIEAFKKLGIDVREEGGLLECSFDEIKPCDIHLKFPSVGATENIMILCTRSKGTVRILNAACEPEIEDLQNMLNCAGARITGGGTPVVTIKGVDKLRDINYDVMPDRIVAATYMGAAAITGGELMIEKVNPSDMYSTMAVFEQMGCGVYPYSDRIFITAKKPLRAVKTVRTTFYPGFPTDCQPIVMAALCKARGTSMIVENIFENRFRAAGELLRMGADIKAEGKVAVIEGVKSLSGASVVAHDLRAGAALVLAGLAAEGTTTISSIAYIDRGYEHIERELSACGAAIKRM